MVAACSECDPNRKKKHLVVVHLCSSILSFIDIKRLAVTEAPVTPELDRRVMRPGLGAAKGDD